jgi:hypothetical protein
VRPLEGVPWKGPLDWFLGADTVFLWMLLPGILSRVYAEGPFEGVPWNGSHRGVPLGLYSGGGPMEGVTWRGPVDGSH